MITREEYRSRAAEAADKFQLDSPIVSFKLYGNGHINDTYKITCSSGKKYILQRINQDVFKKPEQVMHNNVLITEYLRERVLENGGDPDREVLHLIPSRESENPWFTDDLGSVWRVYDFISGAESVELATPELLRESAVAFGNFQYLLRDFDASLLYETIPNFHNTPVRFETFRRVVKEDKLGRAAAVRDDIQFFLDHEKDMSVCTDALAAGRIPLRVTHNDTKINNVMMDLETGKGICILDLDTVMPGISLNDFGDSIRTGASSALEDETDLSKVSMDIDLYRTYTEGFLEGLHGALNEEEMRLLPWGAKILTLENGIRFLGDYLEGDVYFLIDHETHNLDRARTQRKMVESMEQQWDAMQIVK